MATAGPIDLLPRLTRSEAARPVATPGTGHSRRRRIAVFVLFGVAILVLWEAVKWVVGVPWRFDDILGTGIDIDHDPPFRWAFASDLNLPHWFAVLGALAAPVQRNAQDVARTVPGRGGLLHVAGGGHRVRRRGAHGSRAGDGLRPLRGCSSARSCRTSSPARPSRSWPSRRSSCTPWARTWPRSSSSRRT